MTIYLLRNSKRLNYGIQEYAEAKLKKYFPETNAIVSIEEEEHQEGTERAKLLAQMDAIDQILASKEEFVVIWDASYIPCRKIELFTESGTPILDICDELVIYNGVPQGMVPGVTKRINKSFRTGHLLIKTEYLRAMIGEICSDSENGWQQNVLTLVEHHNQEWGVVDLFEVYGSYVLDKHPETYAYREWKTFRQGADLLDKEELTEKLLLWMGRDYDAISFENGHSVREDNRGLISNQEYQARLTPKQLVQAIQGEYRDAVLGDDDGVFTALDLLKVYDNKGKEPEWRVYEKIGDEKKAKNPNQAWLCWQHADYLCDDTVEKNRIREKMANEGRSVPPTAIVIVSYNAKQIMQDCIKSIRRNSGQDEYTLIVVDNASTDGVCEYLNTQKDIRLQLNKNNVGFPAGCNLGVALAPEGEDILFLNNDTRLSHNSLFWLRMGLYESYDTGAVGAVSNYAGTGQMVELLLASAENYEAYGRLKNIPLAEPYAEAKILCGFAMLVKREFIDHFGAMDEAFSPGYYEDTDLSLRLRQHGYQLRICNNAFIYHAGGLNFKKRPDLDEINDRNLLYLAQKWGTDFMN